MNHIEHIVMKLLYFISRTLNIFINNKNKLKQIPIAIVAIGYLLDRDFQTGVNKKKVGTVSPFPILPSKSQSSIQKK